MGKISIKIGPKFEYLPGETWLPVIGFEERYEISDLGRVRSSIHARIIGSQPGKILFQGKDNRGYPQVYLHYGNCKKRTMKVHRLVADAFMGQRFNGETINHKDGNKENNKLENLEAISNIENCRHAFRVIDSRSSVVVFGERMSITEAVERFAVPTVTPKMVRRRIRRYKWAVEKALSTPVQPTGRRKGWNKGNGQIAA